MGKMMDMKERRRGAQLGLVFAAQEPERTKNCHRLRCHAWWECQLEGW